MVHYVSQTKYGRYGNLICTPCSFLIATSFVQRQLADPDPMVGLTPLFVSQAMRASHDLFVEKYASRGKPLMLQELLSFLRPTSLRCIEAAGLMCTDTRSSSVVEVDNLFIGPLPQLLEFTQRHARDQRILASVVVTSEGHTTAYLLDGTSAWLFDPLVASLVPVRRFSDKAASTSAACEYSAIVLFEK